MLKRGGEPGYTIIELLVAIALAGLIGSAVAAVYQVSQQSYTRASSLEAAQLGARAGLDRMANELRLIGSYWVGASGAGNAITAATPISITFMASVDDLYMPIPGALEATTTVNANGTNVPLTNISADDTSGAFKINDYIYIANGSTREVRQITAVNATTLTVAVLSPPSQSSAYPPGSLVRDVKTITYARNAGATSTCPASTCLTRTQGGSGADPFIDNVTGLTFTYYGTTGGELGPNPTLSAIREIQVDLTVQVQGLDSVPRRMRTRVRPRNLPS